MIGNASASSSYSVAAAAISAAAITAAVPGKDDTSIAGAIVLPRLDRLVPGTAGDPEQGGYRRGADHHHPEDYLAQITAPSAVDNVEGNQR